MSDHEIRNAVLSGARDLHGVIRSCGAGGDCRGCHPLLEDLIDEAVMALDAPDELRALQASRRSARMSVDAVA